MGISGQEVVSKDKQSLRDTLEELEIKSIPKPNLVGMKVEMEFHALVHGVFTYNPTYVQLLLISVPLL